MRKVILVLSIFLFVPFLLMGQVNREKTSDLVQGNNRFAFDLFRQINIRPNNLFFSPYNISSCFGMTALGAKEETQQEMFKVLYLNNGTLSLFGELNKNLMTDGSIQTKSTELIIANGIWIEKTFSILPSYQEVLQKNFQITAEEVDFIRQPIVSIKKINDWILKMTKGRISNLLTPQDISSSTALVLTSAIYMKGAWLHPFDLSRTEKRPFYYNEHYSRLVEMMNISDRYPVYLGKDLDIIELPYAAKSGNDAHLSFFILLPKVRDLEVLEKQFNFENWQNWKNLLAMKRVELSLPKFRFEQKIDLNSPMIELGMITAFNKRANFSGISEDSRLYINKAIHKTFIQVDEKGTEAAAATAVSMNLTSVREPEDIIHFVVDHPFLFLIVDKNSDSILFMGKMMSP